MASDVRHSDLWPCKRCGPGKDWIHRGLKAGSEPGVECGS